MSTAQLKELLDDRTIVMPLSVEQYHRMIETEILISGEPIELLDGFLVRKDRSKAGGDPMTVGHAHVLIISKLSRSLVRPTRTDEWHFRAQSPITLPTDNEPEPDGAIVRGRPEDYKGSHPFPADISCVIEVADSSLQRDRVTKRRIYADAGIPQYAIANLVGEVVELHSEPLKGTGRFAKVETLNRGEKLSLLLPNGGTVELLVDEFLP